MLGLSTAQNIRVEREPAWGAYGMLTGAGIYPDLEKQTHSEGKGGRAGSREGRVKGLRVGPLLTLPPGTIAQCTLKTDVFKQKSKYSHFF